VRRIDGDSWNNKRLDFVTFTFQISMHLFENHGGIVVSIRCLDEGIDIPAVSHALILASSKNPREYIQRRGRAYADFAEAWRLLIELEREIRTRCPDKYERQKARGYFTRIQERKHHERQDRRFA